MFSNVLRWTFKIVVGEVEKELQLNLEHDTPLEAVEQVALQMIAHCAKVKEQAKAQAEEKPQDEVKDEGKEQA